MSDAHEAKQATSHATLLAELLDSRVPKSEREHAAAAEIERLRAALNTCVWALRQPLDDWKGECERKALDEARDALKEQR